jgi:hypothetical protein
VDPYGPVTVIVVDAYIGRVMPAVEDVAGFVVFRDQLGLEVLRAVFQTNRMFLSEGAARYRAPNGRAPNLDIARATDVIGVTLLVRLVIAGVVALGDVVLDPDLVEVLDQDPMVVVVLRLAVDEDGMLATTDRSIEPDAVSLGRRLPTGIEELTVGEAAVGAAHD